MWECCERLIRLFFSPFSFSLQLFNVLWLSIWRIKSYTKADTSHLNLPHGTNNWKVENRKLKSKNGYAQEYRQTVRGIRGRGVVPGKEKEGCGAKDLQKRKVLGLEWNSVRDGRLIIISKLINVSRIATAAFNCRPPSELSERNSPMQGNKFAIC